ncbi:Hypothetical_protein [Hexamita inflata]|uniref:Hypothetical_protein n=1 Tax=Hexamita inflata TaxID=28002 RepID=A0ABP1GUU6_9EUKA
MTKLVSFLLPAAAIMSTFFQILLCSVNPKSLHNCLHGVYFLPVALVPLPTVAFLLGFQAGLKTIKCTSLFYCGVIQWHQVSKVSARIHPGVLHELVPSLHERQLVELAIRVLLQLLLDHLVRN